MTQNEITVCIQEAQAPDVKLKRGRIYKSATYWLCVPSVSNGRVLTLVSLVDGSHWRTITDNQIPRNVTLVPAETCIQLTTGE